MTLGARPGARAPAFRLPLVGVGLRSLEDVVKPGGGALLFFKLGCPASELVITHLDALAATLAGEERLLLAVAQEGEDAVRSFRGTHRLPFPIAYETAPYAASIAYGIVTVPTLFVIDGAGVIAERLEGFARSDYLALGASLERALALGEVPPVLDRPEELPAVKPG